MKDAEIKNYSRNKLGKIFGMSLGVLARILYTSGMLVHCVLPSNTNDFYLYFNSCSEVASKIIITKIIFYLNNEKENK